MIKKLAMRSENICLTEFDADTDAATIAEWTKDSRYLPLSPGNPPRPISIASMKTQLEGMKKDEDENKMTFWFAIRSLDEKDLLGLVGLGGIDWANGGAYMRISMRDFDEYSQPSAKDAISIMQRFVFYELHMHLLVIRVESYNSGLIQALLDLGFKEEVRRREAIYQFGKRWDHIHFAITEETWQDGDSNAE